MNFMLGISGTIVDSQWNPVFTTHFIEILVVETKRFGELNSCELGVFRF